MNDEKIKSELRGIVSELCKNIGEVASELCGDSGDSGDSEDTGSCAAADKCEHSDINRLFDDGCRILDKMRESQTEYERLEGEHERHVRFLNKMADECERNIYDENKKTRSANYEELIQIKRDITTLEEKREAILAAVNGLKDIKRIGDLGRNVSPVPSINAQMGIDAGILNSISINGIFRRP